MQTDKTKESVQEIAKELKGIRGEKPVTADELQAAKDGLVLTLAGRWETARAVAGSLGEIVRFGFPDDYYASYPGEGRAPRRSPIVAAAASVIQPDQLVWVIAGDRAKIEPGLRELGLGEIRAIDADGNVK